ncbi:MAG: 3-phosphoshikimate 1-carboxyvinyltransferase [Deltaproteobacteria bacterium]|nr:3-phosphoshikimate 1-carboxyvinyltransferase [Deltaproteobacteria bacterium]
MVPRLRGNWSPPGDKSMTHRALILSSIAEGRSHLYHALNAQDTLATASCLRSLGIKMEMGSQKIAVIGQGLCGLKEPSRILDCKNSGTSLRLLTGLLSAQKFESILTGDASLRKRPMGELVSVLTSWGASIQLSSRKTAPVKIKKPIQKPKLLKIKFSYSSAQYKSALLLAGLYLDRLPQITETFSSRDHTERLLKRMGIPPRADNLYIPGDLSSAAPILALATLLPGSNVKIQQVGLNPGRLGFVSILQKMGGHIEITKQEEDYEPWGDMVVQSARLKAIHVTPEMSMRAIDELPLVCLLATQAEGVTRVEGASSLRFKESNRLQLTYLTLKKIGAKIQVTPDGFRISGPTRLSGGKVSTQKDHRMAILFSVAQYVTSGDLKLEETRSIANSFPDFKKTLNRLCEKN